MSTRGFISSQTLVSGLTIAPPAPTIDFGPISVDPCAFITNPTAKLICQGIVPGGGGNGGGDGGTGDLPFGFDPAGECRPGSVMDAGGVCRDLTPDFDTPAELGPVSPLHGPDAHRDHIPAIRAVRTRMCRRGSVLGKDGFCHPKGTIRNSDREYPKGRRPLGTPADLKAVTVAARFGRRLVSNKKRLKKLERDLAKAS